MPELLRKFDYRPSDIHIYQADLDVDISEKDQVSLRACLYLTREKVGNILVLDWQKDKELKSITLLNGESLKYEKNGGEILITLPESKYLDNEKHIAIIVDTIVIPSQTSPSDNGIYNIKDDSGEIRTITTQCEPPPGISYLIPFNDRSSETTFWTIRLRAKPGDFPTLLAIGEQINKGVNDDGTITATYATWHRDGSRHAISPYLFAFFATKMEVSNDVYVGKDGDKTSIGVYFEDACDKVSSTLALQVAKRVLEFKERRLQSTYLHSKINIVACSNFEYGAMENPGMIPIQKSRLFIDPETSRDEDWLRINDLLGHEIIHSIAGNTFMRKWLAEIHVTEGINMFLNGLYLEEFGGKRWARMSEISGMRKFVFPLDDTKDTCPAGGPAELDNAKDIFNKYPSILYRKGSEVVRMLYTILGEAEFMAILREIEKKYRGKTISIDDMWEVIFEHVEEQKRKGGIHLDLRQFRETWYNQTGTLTCKLSTDYRDVTEDRDVKEQANGGIFSVTVEQKLFHTDQDKPYYLPMTLGLLDEHGNDMVLEMVTAEGEPVADTPHDLKRGIIHVSQEKQTFYFRVPAKPKAVSAFRNWSAPVRIETDENEESLRFRMEHDSDGINRIEAAREITMRTYKLLYQQLKSGQPLVVPENILAAYHNVFSLSDEDLDVAVFILTPPSLMEIMEVLGGRTNMQEVYTIAQTLQQSIATRYRYEFEEMYQRFNADNSPVSYPTDATRIHKRHLKKLCLDYLLPLDDNDSYKEWASTQAQNANNMADRYNAYTALCQLAAADNLPPVSKEVFARSSKKQFVYDHWFEAQVSSPMNGLNWAQTFDSHSEFYRNDTTTFFRTYFNFIDNSLCFHTPEGYLFILGQIKRYDEDQQKTFALRLLNKFKKAHATIKKYLFKEDLSKLEAVINDFLTNNKFSEKVTRELSTLIEDGTK